VDGGLGGGHPADERIGPTFVEVGVRITARLRSPTLAGEAPARALRAKRRVRTYSSMANTWAGPS